MATHCIPDPKTRNRAEDLKTLALAVVKDRLSAFSGDSPLSDFTAEGGDPLLHYVSGALKSGFRVYWGDLAEGEHTEVCARVKVWTDYCFALFNEVPEFVRKLIADAPAR
jgi:hypothetical protein